MQTKYKKLGLSIIFDALGMATFAIPFVGDFGDVVWAPVAAWLMTRMYKGMAGKAAGIIAFIEEALPFTDVIPTFTLMWLYTYVYKKEEKPVKSTIEVESL